MAAASAALWRTGVLADRLRARVVLATMIALLYGAIMALNITLVVRPPQLYLILSVSSSGQAHVSWVMPGTLLWDRGIRTDDRVLTVDGHPPARGADGAWQGAEVTVQTAHGRTEVNASALRHGHDTWPLLVLSPWFLLLGTLVVLRAPNLPVGRAAYALFASAALALALAPGADDGEPIAAAAELAAVPLFAFAFVRFFLAFPISRHVHGWSRLIAVPPLAAAVLGLASLLWPSLYNGVSLLRLALLPIYLLLGVGLLIYGFAGTTDRRARSSLIVISATTALSVLPFTAFFLVPTVLGVHPLMASEHAILALALLPAGFTYAILRHGALHVRLLQCWLVHTALWVGVPLLCAGTAYVLHAVLGAPFPAPNRDLLLAAGLGLVAGVCFCRTYGRLLPFLDSLIFKDSYDYRASLQQLSRDLSLAGDLDAVGQALPGTLCRLMNLEFAILLVRDELGTHVHGAAGSYSSETLPALVEAAHHIEEARRGASMLYEGSPTLVIPLRARENLVGHLCLGAKITQEPFRAVDHDLLFTLSNHLAVLVRNAQLGEDLRLSIRALDVLNERLEHAQEEERVRIAADLHDEPLQTAIELQRQLTGASDQNGKDETPLALSRTLIDQLRAVWEAMCPVALDDLGLHAALALLVDDLRNRSAIPITLEVNTELASCQMPAASELILYRAAQEALNNCLKYAHASMVKVTLLRHQGSVQLRVADDGAGFVVPNRLDHLALEGHLGLAGLQRRLERAGGTLTIRSTPGEGTVLQVRLHLLGEHA